MSEEKHRKGPSQPLQHSLSLHLSLSLSHLQARFSGSAVPSLMMVDAPRRSYDRLRMDPCWDYQDHTGSPLAHGHSFFFSAPTSPRARQAAIPNDNLGLSSLPDLRFEVQDGNGRDKRDPDEEEFEFEFVSPVSESEEPPFSPTIIFTSSSRMLLRPPPPPLLKPPPHLRKPHPLSTQEASPASEKSDVLEEDETAAVAGQKQEKPLIKVKKWRLKEFLSRSKGQKQKPPPIPQSWPDGRQQEHSMSSCCSSSVVPGKKLMNGTAMQKKASSPPAFPLPPPPRTPISSMPSSTRSATVASPHEILYRSKRAQLHDRQKKTSLPYRPGFLGCLGFASKCYIPIAEFSRFLHPVA